MGWLGNPCHPTLQNNRALLTVGKMDDRMRKFIYLCISQIQKTCLHLIHHVMNDKYKIPYINACIRAFAKRFMLSTKTAFEYLYRFKGIDFLVEFYEVEHLQSIDDAVDDLIVCCFNNGGTLK